MKNFKPILIVAIILFTITPVLHAQYVNNYQAVYPHKYGEYTTKNYTFATDFKNEVYLIAANTISASYTTALSGLILDGDFSLLLNRTYVLSNLKYSAIITHDAKSTSDHGYVICGQLKTDDLKCAFISKFDGKFGFEWLRIYPEISNLYSVTEIVTKCDIKQKYMAAGEFRGSTYGNGVLLCVTDDGSPIWERRTASGGKSDRQEFRQVIQLKNVLTIQKNIMFAAVGTSVTQPSSNYEALVSYFDVNGNVNYTLAYGLPNDEKIRYREEGFGLTQGTKGDLFITGRSKCHYTFDKEILWDDVLLFSIKTTTGNVNWAKRYGMPRSMNFGEYGQKVLVRKEDLYVSGYYKGYLFNPKGSYDAFVIKTKYDGTPSENRIFGDENDDLALTVMNNIKYDGVIAAGFSNSFLDTDNYSPYVIETYNNTKKRCHDAIYRLSVEEMKLDNWKMAQHNLFTKEKKWEFVEIKVPVDHKEICSKVPSFGISTLKSKELEESEKASLKMYPSVVNSYLKIRGANSGVKYSLYSISGKQIAKGVLTDSEIDINNLSTGIYLVKIENQVMKFVKE